MCNLSGELTVIGTDHCIMIAKDRERLSVSKQEAQNLGEERFSLKG
jgi:hypothetical protein